MTPLQTTISRNCLLVFVDLARMDGVGRLGLHRKMLILIDILSVTVSIINYNFRQIVKVIFRCNIVSPTVTCSCNEVISAKSYIINFSACAL